MAAEHAAYVAGEREGDPRYTFAGASAILVISNLWRIIDEFADLSVHATLAGLASQLSGIDRLRLYHDAMLYKDSANPASPWHQDEWFRLTDRIVTAWMPFTALEREGGTLIYARASHHQGIIDCWNMRDAQVHEHLEGKGYDILPISLQPGDVLIHTGMSFHRSDRIETDGPRYAFTAFFYEDGRRLRPQPFSDSLVDLVYFPGQQLGEVAGSALNPLVYDRIAASGAPGGHGPAT
jgi:ectoine hydroxylase-related dioxygenase (phytanoyl-CoA dioxygenase family)